MKLSTFVKGAIVGSASGFALGFSFFWICPVDFPYWGMWMGALIGGVLFNFLSDRALRWALAIIWLPSLVGVAIGIFLSAR